MLSHLLISFPPGRGGGRARGAARRVRVCDCNEGPLARDHWVCTINNEGALKKERKKTDSPREGWEDGTPPPHRDFKERCVVR